MQAVHLMMTLSTEISVRFKMFYTLPIKNGSLQSHSLCCFLAVVIKWISGKCRFGRMQ